MGYNFRLLALQDTGVCVDPTEPRHSNSAIKLTYMVFRFATVQGQNVDWLLRRNCAVSPKQLAWFYMSMCAVSMVIATAFWFQGATLVMPFAWLELLAVGGCFLVYARHASDGEAIHLRDHHLVVELENAGKLERFEFRREWVRVEPKTGDNSLIEVYGQGRSVQVGRYVRPELRPVLAKEIRMALRMA